MGDATKSLAAEIEAVMKRHVRLNGREKWDEPYYSLIGFPEAAAEIAALQSRAFEDGARWMRERAVRLAEGEVCHGRYRTWSFWPADAHGERGNRDEASELARHSRDIAAAIAALPLQPEGERNA